MLDVMRIHLPPGCLRDRRRWRRREEENAFAHRTIWQRIDAPMRIVFRQCRYGSAASASMHYLPEWAAEREIRPGVWRSLDNVCHRSPRPAFAAVHRAIRREAERR